MANVVISKIVEIENEIYSRPVALEMGEDGLHSHYEIEVSRPVLAQIFGLSEQMIDIATNCSEDIEKFVLPENYVLPTTFITKDIILELDNLEKLYCMD